jgi:hypothetical protein
VRASRADLEAKEQAMTLRRLLIPAIMGCASLAVAAPASARPPERFTDTQSGSEVLAHCDGFDVIEAFTATAHGTIFFDQSGLDVRAVIRVRGTETFTNSITLKTVVSSAVFTDFFTRIDGTDEFRHKSAALTFTGKSTGEGPILLQDAGRKVFDSQTGDIIFRAGHTNIPEGPAAEAVFCAAVA